MSEEMLFERVGFIEAPIPEADLLELIKLKCDKALISLKSDKKNILDIIDEDGEFEFELTGDRLINDGLKAIINCQINNEPYFNKDSERVDKIYSRLLLIIKSDIILNLQFNVLNKLNVKVPKKYMDNNGLNKFLITGKMAKSIASKIKKYDEFKFAAQVLENDIKVNDVFSLPHFLIYIYSIKDKMTNGELPSYKINSNILKLKYTKSNRVDNFNDCEKIIDHIYECESFSKLINVLNEIKELKYDAKFLILYLFNRLSPLIEIRTISNILSNASFSGIHYIGQNSGVTFEYDESFPKYINEKYDLKSGNIYFPPNFYISKNLMFKIYLAEIYSYLVISLPNVIDFYDELINQCILEIESNFSSKKIEQLNKEKILLNEEYLLKLFNFNFDDRMVGQFLDLKSRDYEEEKLVITSCYKESYKAWT